MKRLTNLTATIRPNSLTNSKSYSRTSVAFGIIVLSFGTLSSRSFATPLPDWTVTETSNGKNATVTAWATDANDQRIQPSFFINTPLNAENNYTVMHTFTDGLFVDIDGNAVPVYDVEQEITLLENTGEVSNLKIESVLFDTMSGLFSLEPIPITLTREVGFFQVIEIPDLFADTDGSGSIGEGDVLYSMVDLNVYLVDIPTFSFGDNFTVVNGLVASLSGMQFSSTPFAFSPATGFIGTPFTGAAVVEARHSIESIPEPSTLSLLAVGGLILARRRR